MDRNADGSISISREELYALVWETPLSKLAPDLGTLPVTVGMACDKHQVPRPRNGHWSRCRTGNVPSAPPLPEVEDDELKTVIIPPSGFRRPADAGSVAIVVPDLLTDPHPLVKRTEAALHKAKERDSPIVHVYDGGLLDVSVSHQALDRAMRILDTLLKASEERGWPVEVNDRHAHRGTLLIVEDERIPVRLEEKTRREERPPTPQEKKDAERYPTLYKGPWHQYVGTGQLTLTFDMHLRDGLRRRWSDGRHQRLEDLLPMVMEALARYAALAREERLKSEERHRRWKEEERLRAEKQARLREEEARVQRLLAEVDAWHQAERIRAYVDDVRKRVRQARGPSGTDNVKEWADWALSHADRIDPMVTHELTALDPERD